MSVKEAPYYWVECDGCGERCEYGEFSAMSDPGQAIDGALEDEWTGDGSGKHHCPSCPPLARCEDCGKPAIPSADPADPDLCGECVAKAEAVEVHLLRDDFTLACGQDDRGYSSGVLAEVTCTACKEVAS